MIIITAYKFLKDFKKTVKHFRRRFTHSAFEMFFIFYCPIPFLEIYSAINMFSDAVLFSLKYIFVLYFYWNFPGDECNRKFISAKAQQSNVSL